VWLPAHDHTRTFDSKPKAAGGILLAVIGLIFGCLAFSMSPPGLDGIAEAGQRLGECRDGTIRARCSAPQPLGRWLGG